MPWNTQNDLCITWIANNHYYLVKLTSRLINVLSFFFLKNLFFFNKKSFTNFPFSFFDGGILYAGQKVGHRKDQRSK